MSSKKYKIQVQIAGMRIIANAGCTGISFSPIIIENYIKLKYRQEYSKFKTPMKNPYPSLAYLFTLIIIAQVGQAQLSNPSAIHIESKKFSAISGQEAQTKVTPERVNYTIPYQRSFTSKPDVGLSVYSLQFDYNPQFSINVIQESSTMANLVFYVSGRPSDSNIYNQLYIMYIASDYNQLGIYMPGPKNTTAQLGIPTSIANRSQQFTFNFKNIGTQPIFSSMTNTNNIRVTVYLTGIEGQSQTIQNGYSKNYAYFALSVSKITNSFYTIQVSVHSSSGDVQIKTIQFTVVYFDITRLAEAYQMNSNFVVASNFGGTFFMSSYSTPLESLPEDASYQNTLQYFFGISSIQCSQGDTINLLAVQRFNYNANGKLQNLLLTFQTQGNTYIRNGVYNYIQYKPKTCNDSASCGISCNDPNQPSYRITNTDNQCAPCLYFCSACQNGFNCTSCPATRTLSGVGICNCANRTLYDDQASRECQTCFDTNFCNTCQRKGVCETCYTSYNFTFNVILRTCECSAATYNAAGSARNASALLVRITSICQPCPPNCIYCTSFNTCQACTTTTYLAIFPATINGIVQTCSYMCNENQVYSPLNRNCTDYMGDTSLFDSAGRLGYDWTYTTQDNEMIINLLFSQRNMSYYFFENGKGYQYVNTGNSQNQGDNQGSSAFYYDDGNGYIGGYSGTGPTSFESSIIKISQSQNSGYNFDESALKGEYYGFGEAKFFSQQYKKYQPKVQYFDQFGIPFGKHKLNSTAISPSATFLDAIRNNLDFTIDGQSLPYTIKALSGNQFQLIVRPQKSYLTTNASVVFKNPALVRSGQTALQTPSVTKQIDRLDYYTQSQLQNALSLRDRTATIVQILWGICKYLLFIGFGWVVMPLMLTLQYIFSHNYITTQLPLNLYYFLTSFADFRNPSILFNPQRNNFDATVVNHPQIYKTIPIYERFDRGIDFMKNCWEFFFVPLLSFGLLFLLIFFNFIINKLCKRDITLISKYLQKRSFLHAGAYTLVQALPVSFFFFGQLHDTRYSSVNSPNSIYPSFNAGMAYASFFTSAILPLVLLVWIYNYFKNRARSGKFQLNKISKNNEDVNMVSNDPAMIGDPLWSGNPYMPVSYGFGASVFYLPLLAGFVLSFFNKSYPWQLTGLLLGNTALASFAAASNHFESKVPRFFFIGIGALMIAYELVHAGVGSNRALTTYDQWNTGYLGIGIIYAMILAAIIFSGYLLYKLITNLYQNIIKPLGCFPKLGQQTPIIKTIPDQEVNLRDKVLGRDQRRKTTIAQSKLSYLPPHSEDRMLHSQREGGTMNDIGYAPLYSQSLLFEGVRPDGKTAFRCKDSNNILAFPKWSSDLLKQNMPLIIDSQNKIYTENGKRLLGTVSRLQQQNQQSESSQDLMLKTKMPRSPIPRQIYMTNMLNSNDLNNAYQMVKSNNSNNPVKTYDSININGRPINYEQDGSNYYLLNYNGVPRYKMPTSEFFRIFSQNQNRIPYDNRQYYIEQSQDPEYFYLVYPSTYKKANKLSVQNLSNLLKDKNKKAATSTSLLPSRKSISEVNQYVEYHPTASNRSIVYTKDTQQYLINGNTYEKIGEDEQYYFFRNLDNEQKLSMKKSQAHIRSGQTQQRRGSLKELLESRIAANQNTLMYEGQRYQYKGQQNGRYSFMNMNTGSFKFFSPQELAQVFGIRENQFMIDSASNPSSLERNEATEKKLKTPAIASNMTALRLAQTNQAKGVYIFQNPLTSERYEMPMQWIDMNQKVYVDKDENIWHKDEMLGVDSSSQSRSSSEPSSSQNNVVQSQRMRQGPIVSSTNNVPSSSSSLNLSQNINPSHLYNIKFLSPNYVYSSNRLPSEKDIEQVKENIRGVSVPNLVGELRRINPYGKILIENLSKPSQKFIIQ